MVHKDQSDTPTETETNISFSFVFFIFSHLKMNKYVRMDKGVCLSVCLSVCLCQLYSLNGLAEFDEISQK